MVLPVISALIFIVKLYAQRGLPLKTLSQSLWGLARKLLVLWGGWLGLVVGARNKQISNFHYTFVPTFNAVWASIIDDN